MTHRAALIAVVAALAAPFAAHGQTTLQSHALYDGDTTARTPKGAARPLHVSVRMWELGSAAGLREVPLKGFYIARAVGGDVRTVIDGARVDRAPEDLWVVPAGSSMRIEAINEYASVETIAIGPVWRGPRHRRHHRPAAQ